MRALPLLAALTCAACATRIETVIRNRLRSEFGTTLPRFDLLAQLEPVLALPMDGSTQAQVFTGESAGTRMPSGNGKITAVTRRFGFAGVSR